VTSASSALVTLVSDSSDGNPFTPSLFGGRGQTLAQSSARARTVRHSSACR
jgi:hypothetical protein